MTNSDVGFCPHCGNNAIQTLHAPALITYDNGTGTAHYLAKCSTCNEVLFYRQHLRRNGFEPVLEDLVWPSSGTLHAAVPTRVRSIYQEAARIKGRAPNAFANQMGRALEAVCHDRGANKGVLAQKLKTLADNGDIPTTLAEMAMLIKDFRNIGSHDGDEDVESPDADVIDEFFRAVIEYVYVAPYKLNAVQAAIAEKRAPANPTKP
jgi:hypothetical protein